MPTKLESTVRVLSPKAERFPSARWGKTGGISMGEVQGKRERDGATLHFVKQVASHSQGFCLLYVLIQFI